MGNTVADWLIGHFAVFGIQFQNWMLIAVAIVVLATIAIARK